MFNQLFYYWGFGVICLEKQQQRYTWIIINLRITIMQQKSSYISLNLDEFYLNQNKSKSLLEFSKEYLNIWDQTSFWSKINELMFHKVKDYLNFAIKNFCNI